jgi:ribonuclease HI
VHVSSSSTTTTKTTSSKTTATKEPRFYGIAAGHTPGVYTDWSDAQEQIVGYKQPKYKKFATLAEAVEFVQKTIPGFVYDGAEESEEPPRKRVKKDGDEVGSESKVVVEGKEGKEDDGNGKLCGVM